MDEDVLKGKTLLVVDDETDLRDIVASELEFMGATVYQAENIAVAKRHLEANQIDLIVSDIRMPGGTGIDLLDHVKSKNTQIPPVILITGFADITVEDAYNKGSEALMNKPFKLDDLIKTVARFTYTQDERFKNWDTTPTTNLELNFPGKLGDLISQNLCAIGRGGITVRLETKGRKVDLGEPINFKFVFEAFTLEGIAVCRWMKHVEHTTQGEAGFEFLGLKEASLKFMLNYWKTHNPVPFIPTLVS